MTEAESIPQDAREEEDRVLEFIATCPEGASYFTVTTELSIARTRAVSILERLHRDGRLSYDCKTKMYYPRPEPRPQPDRLATYERKVEAGLIETPDPELDRASPDRFPPEPAVKSGHPHGKVGDDAIAACQFCGDKMPYNKVRRHEPVCGKNPNRNTPHKEKKEERMPCPIEDCKCTLRKDRKAVYQHLYGPVHGLPLVQVHAYLDQIFGVERRRTSQSMTVCPSTLADGRVPDIARDPPGSERQLTEEPFESKKSEIGDCDNCSKRTTCESPCEEWLRKNDKPSLESEQSPSLVSAPMSGTIKAAPSIKEKPVEEAKVLKETPATTPLDKAPTAPPAEPAPAPTPVGTIPLSNKDVSEEERKFWAEETPRFARELREEQERKREERATMEQPLREIEPTSDGWRQFEKDGPPVPERSIIPEDDGDSCTTPMAEGGIVTMPTLGLLGEGLDCPGIPLPLGMDKPIVYNFNIGNPEKAMRDLEQAYRKRLQKQDPLALFATQHRIRVGREISKLRRVEKKLKRRAAVRSVPRRSDRDQGGEDRGSAAPGEHRKAHRPGEAGRRPAART